MTEKKFSIIFPTRERRFLLGNLLRSIRRNTMNPEDVEILVAYDNDDLQTRGFIFENQHLPVTWVVCERTLNFSRDYYSMLAKQTQGRWLVICNDDVEFRTPRWDVLAWEALMAAVGEGSDIWYGWVEDDLGAARCSEFNDYSCFPILSKQGVDALGYVFPERIPCWGADIWARYLYGEIARVVKVPITLSHICHHNGTRGRDDINKRVQEISGMFSMKPTPQEINTLLQFIREDRKCMRT